MKDISFDDLRWLNLLLVVAGVAAIGAYGIWQKRRALRAFAELPLLRLGSQEGATMRIRGPEDPRGRKSAESGGGGIALLGIARPIVRIGLISTALIALTAAIIGPRWGQAEQKVVRRGIDVMVVLDVSRSMLARDIAPNRLERAKLAIQDDLLPALGGDRIGIIAFAGLPVLKCPLTSDYGFVRLALEDIDVGSSPRGGTLIGDALRKAQASFDKTLDTYKLAILITDGEDQESYPVEAAKKLWEESKIPVVSIALGDEREGARIPVPTGRGEEYVRYKGEEVRSKANFDDLRKIAQVSGLNAFIPVGTRDFRLDQIYRDKIVPLIEYHQRTEAEVVRQPWQGHWFAMLALALLLVDSFLRDGPAAATAAGLIKRIRDAA